MNSGLPPTAEEKTPEARLRVLLVEDNIVNQQLALALLKRLGWTASLAGNGFAAILALERGNFGLVLMDVQMPVMDGLVATKEIRRRLPRECQPAIIAFTANTLPGDREKCLAAGMDDYLTKPLLKEALQNTLSRWLNRNSRYFDEKEESLAIRAEAGSTPEESPAEGEPAEVALPGLDARRFQEMQELFKSQPGGFHQAVLAPFSPILDGYVQELDRAIQGEDIDAVRAVSHTIKGAVRNLGFTALGQLSEAMELDAKKGSLAVAHAQCDALHREVLAVQNYIRSNQR